MKVTVVGAGKMGLPLACQFASRGASMTACDVNPRQVEAINSGRCPIEEPGVPELLAEVVRQGRLRATTQTAAAVAESDVVVVIVPALLTDERDADLSMLEAAAREIARGLRPGTMVSFETTLPVGGTRRHLKPLLEERGLRAGHDFDLVFSPERVKSQSVLRNLSDVPKIVGGYTPEAAERAAEFYVTYLGAPIINLQTLEAAEFAKLAGMVYRDVNIALANELAQYAETVGVNLPPVLEAANTDGEARILSPGIGVGGHCTPVYPYFLIRDAAARGVPALLTEHARGLNDLRVCKVLDRVEREWERLEGRTAVILGLGFRPQVKEHVCSPAFLIRDELQQRGASVFLCDPLYTAAEIRGHGFEPAERPAAEVVILNTAHRAFRNVDFTAWAATGTQVVVDGRNAWDAAMARSAGLAYFGMGRPSPRTEAPADCPTWSSNTAPDDLPDCHVMGDLATR